MKLESQLLTGIYALPHVPLTPNQNEESCEAYIEIVRECLKPIWSLDTYPVWLSEEDGEL